jgi:hypothetical protein
VPLGERGFVGQLHTGTEEPPSGPWSSRLPRGRRQIGAVRALCREMRGARWDPVQLSALRAPHFCVALTLAKQGAAAVRQRALGPLPIGDTGCLRNPSPRSGRIRRRLGFVHCSECVILPTCSRR